MEPPGRPLRSRPTLSASAVTKPRRCRRLARHLASCGGGACLGVGRCMPWDDRHGALDTWTWDGVAVAHKSATRAAGVLGRARHVSSVHCGRLRVCMSVLLSTVQETKRPRTMLKPCTLAGPRPCFATRPACSSAARLAVAPPRARSRRQRNRAVLSSLLSRPGSSPGHLLGPRRRRPAWEAQPARPCARGQAAIRGNRL